jgi:hypothetical protein
MKTPFTFSSRIKEVIKLSEKHIYNQYVIDELNVSFYAWSKKEDRSPRKPQTIKMMKG